MYMYMWKRKAGKTEGRSRNRKSRNIDKIRIDKDTRHLDKQLNRYGFIT